jgi:aminotransferase
MSKRTASIQVSAIKQLPVIASQLPNTISLGQGIPDVPTPGYIRDGVIELLRTTVDVNKYSLQPGLPALRQTLAERLQRSVDEICITAGAMEGLLSTLFSVIDPGDEAIVFDPGYASHIEQIKLADGVPVFVPNCAALAAAITNKTKVIIVCQPGNPTGAVLSAADLKLISDLAIQHNLVIISDETYDFLVYDNVPYSSLLTIPEIQDRLVVTKSFSKQYAMTGWRVGYVVAPIAIIQEIFKVHDANVICAPAISQYAALIALTGQPYPDDVDIKQVLTERRAVICAELDLLPDLFSYEKPQGAYYILAKYLKTNLSSWDFCLKLLYETGVITIPGSAFGPSGEGHIRFAFGGKPSDIQQAFERIKQWNKTL